MKRQHLDASQLREVPATLAMLMHYHVIMTPVLSAICLSLDCRPYHFKAHLANNPLCGDSRNDNAMPDYVAWDACRCCSTTVLNTAVRVISSRARPRVHVDSQQERDNINLTLFRSILSRSRGGQRRQASANVRYCSPHHH